MADIDVKRERKSAWGWVLFVALLALISWGAWELIFDDDEVEIADVPPVPMAEPITTTPEPVADPTVPPMPVPAPAGSPGEVPAQRLVPTAVVVVDPVQITEAMRAYDVHVGRDVPADGEHLYSAAGISRLGTLLSAIVGREPGPNPDVVAKANAFFLIANLLVASPDTLRLHADWMHKSALAAVDAMAELGETRFPGAAGLEAELSDARAAANAIRPEEGLMGQREEVRRFFREARDPLLILAERASAGARGA